MTVHCRELRYVDLGTILFICENSYFLKGRVVEEGCGDEQVGERYSTLAIDAR